VERFRRLVLNASLRAGKYGNKTQEIIKALIDSNEIKLLEYIPDFLVDESLEGVHRVPGENREQLLSVDKYSAGGLRASVAHLIGRTEFSDYFTWSINRLLPRLKLDAVDVRLKGLVAARIGSIGDPAAVPPINDSLASLQAEVRRNPWDGESSSAMGGD
jgi:hypothetical protein